MKVLAFHGTDYDVAQKIDHEGFISKPSLEHWLGNAIYFYIDELLAKWWTTRPSNKFGTTIKKPALIKAYISVEDDRVLDLRKLDDYNTFIKWENEYEKQTIEMSNKMHTGCPIDFKEYRCGLFDSIFRDKGIDVIVGCFHKPNQPYFTTDKIHDILRRLELTYAEIQVAVKAEKQKEIITIVDIYKQNSV